MAAGTRRNSRFAVTCGLLGRYMRAHPQPEHHLHLGSIAGALLRPPPPQLQEEREGNEETDARTLQLFPEKTETRAAEKLTIFYEGQVLVFEDFPAYKARELIELLESSCSPALSVPRKMVVAVLSNLPMTRKASLRRFLETRKHRIRAAYSPYNRVR